MILEQVRDEMNRVNWVLDEFESIHGRGRKRRHRRTELLEMAVLASIRGVEALIDEQWTKDPEYLVTDEHAFIAAEWMRQDAALLRAFIAAECRLLEDIGVRPEAVRRIMRGLEGVLLDPEGAPEPPVERLERLIGTLRADLQALEKEGHDELVMRRLTGVLEALGGGLIVATNGIVGAGLTPVTGGLSAAGAAVSGAVGVEMVNRGATKALEA